MTNKTILIAIATIIVVGTMTSTAFADHLDITIVPAAGSGSPGCEETADGCFIPSTATVDVGGVVIMSNTDSAAHTFTAGTPADGPSGEFDTGLLMAGNSFEYTPDTVGEIPYFCMVHPWMMGLIIVQPSSNQGDTESPIITLKGESMLTLEFTVESYIEQGATVSDNDPNYVGSIVIGGDTVDINTVGIYMITYNANSDPSGNVPAQVTRTVTVQNSDQLTDAQQDSAILGLADVIAQLFDGITQITVALNTELAPALLQLQTDVTQLTTTQNQLIDGVNTELIQLKTNVNTMQTDTAQLQSQVGASITYVILQDESCNAQGIGWCPDGVKSNFILTGLPVTENSVVNGNYEVPSNLITGETDKQMVEDACFRVNINPIGIDTNPILIIQNCNLPLDGSDLNLVIINPLP